MAHDVNFKMKDFSVMYNNVSDVLLSDDISFGNLEFPIDDTKPYSTYPRFNVNSPYVRTAIDAGFDVFSLANNHSNDQGLKSVLETIKSTFLLQTEYKNKTPSRNIYFSGLQASAFDGYYPVIFEYEGTKIAFLAITEILNNYDSSKNKVNLVSYTDELKAEFVDRIKRIKEIEKPDLFIVSIHIAEPEYVRTITQKRKDYFQKLAEAGIDIIWAQHPHIALPWEIFKRSDDKESLIMYSMGNFVSGQRYRVNVTNPESSSEYTGDSFLLSVNLTKNEKGNFEFELNPVLITTWINRTTREVEVYKLNKEFIDSRDEAWKIYYTKRFNLMKEQFGDLLPWTKIE